MTPPYAVPFDALPGFGRYFLDHTGGRLPAALRTARRPEEKGIWALRREERGPAGPMDEGLASALRLEHRRLGASPESRANLEAMASGAAFAVITGQQPGLFGGPMHTRLKVATTVAVARLVSGREGTPCVPVFWNGADDADFDEVSQVSLAGADLAVKRFALSADARRPRAWVGDIDTAVVREAAEQARAILADAGENGAIVDRLLGPAAAERDFGDGTSRLYLELFAADGLVVADARLPEIRRAAAPLFARYLERHEAVHAALRDEARRMEQEGYPPQIEAEGMDTALFLTPERERLRLTPEETIREARRLLGTHPSDLSPNVILRPLVSDTVFPTLAQVAGPSEYVYLSQLRPVYEALDVGRPILLDRLSLTLVPGEARDVASGLGVPVKEMLADPEEALRRWHETKIPSEFHAASAEARAGIGSAFDALRKASRPIDASLVQQIDSASEKALFQLSRVEDGVRKKIKHQTELSAPRLRHLAEFLRPRRKPQERELTALTFELLAGDAGGALVAEAAAEHAERLLAGQRSHYGVEIP